MVLGDDGYGVVGVVAVGANGLCRPAIATVADDVVATSVAWSYMPSSALLVTAPATVGVSAAPVLVAIVVVVPAVVAVAAAAAGTVVVDVGVAAANIVAAVGGVAAVLVWRSPRAGCGGVYAGGVCVAGHHTHCTGLAVRHTQRHSRRRRSGHRRHGCCVSRLQAWCGVPRRRDLANSWHSSFASL